ncbi:hypothetical protein [Nocardiopsis sp. CC223A]|uniref:hypothetical protein n=1 Tax=Nocardiopsis sp. CC223A TaxID=3044051 RepID=UPI002795BDE5|nr:hypothetical protein [Nocardiopsis sp. CC223A]
MGEFFIYFIEGTNNRFNQAENIRIDIERDPRDRMIKLGEHPIDRLYEFDVVGAKKDASF